MRTIHWLVIAGCVAWPAAAVDGGTDDDATVLRSVYEREPSDDVPNRRDLLAEPPSTPGLHWAVGDVQLDGAWMTFDQRAEAASADELLAEYRSLREEQALNLDWHRELASWCRQHGLRDQERAHLAALIDGGVSSPEVMKRFGCRLTNGLWLDEQQLVRFERSQREHAENVRRWRARATMLAKRLAEPTSVMAGHARRQLTEIDDITAIPALELALAGESPELAAEFLEWVRRRPEIEASLALTRQAVLSPWSSVRATASDALRSRRWDQFVPVLLDGLTLTSIEQGDLPEIAGVWQSLPVVAQTLRVEFRGHVMAYRHAVRLQPAKVQVVVARGAALRRPTLEHKVVAMQRERSDLDFHRHIDTVVDISEAHRAALDARFHELNTRIATTLRTVTGEQSLQSPRQWWTWWAKVSDRSPPPSAAQKPVIEVSETETLPGPEVVILRAASCLPAGTLVQTETGPMPIERIQAGDRVLAKHIDTGELAYRVVLHTTVRQPQPLVKLSFADETIEATRGHHFWVSGKGWRMAREIQPGDRLHGVRGTARVTDVSTGGMAEVYNLVVDRANTCFVGNSLVLSHDVTFPEPTNIKVPGLAATSP